MNARGVSVVALMAMLCTSLAAQQAPPQQAPAPSQLPPLHVYIRAGLKSHGPGQHDYPQYLADWSKLLTDHGAIVDGGLHFPSTDELAGVNVIVMYKGDAGYMTTAERASLEAFLKRGGGLVSFHDTLCADDPPYIASILGGSKKHGEVNYSAGDIAYTIVDKANPIMQGMSDFKIDDEAFFKMTWAQSPAIHVLATAAMPNNKAEVVPQIWTYERTFGQATGLGPTYRAFVWMQGHNYSNFANPVVQPMILRGIAWAAKWPVETLLTDRAAARQGGAGGRGAGRGGAAMPLPAGRN